MEPRSVQQSELLLLRGVLPSIKNNGEKVVVVVSAMSGETNRLVELGRKVLGESSPQHREYHPLVTSGEQVSAALMAMALERVGLSARSLLAHQLGFQTKEVYGLNLIQSIEIDKLRSLLERDITPVVAGFQGLMRKVTVQL